MDLRTRPPRSPRVRLGGFVHLPRMLDKARAHVAGTLGEYIWPCPLDKRLLAFAGISPEEVVAQVSKGLSDTQFLAWFRAQLPKELTEVAIENWSRWLENLGPGDAQRHQGFADSIKELAPGRDDIRTNFDRLDVDDYVSFGGKA